MTGFGIRCAKSPGSDPRELLSYLGLVLNYNEYVLVFNHYS
jgi:hypothetical protein